jgi:hypothetical protein
LGGQQHARQQEYDRKDYDGFYGKFIFHGYSITQRRADIKGRYCCNQFSSFSFLTR